MIDLTKEYQETKIKEEQERKRIEKHHARWDEISKNMDNAILDHMEDLVGGSLRGDYPNLKLSIFPPRIENEKIDVSLICVLVMIRKEGGVLDTISQDYKMVYHVKKKKLEVAQKRECLWRVSYSTKYLTLREVLAMVITPYWANYFKMSRKEMKSDIEDKS